MTTCFSVLNDDRKRFGSLHATMNEMVRNDGLSFKYSNVAHDVEIVFK